MLSLQSAKASEWRTGPIRCAESLGAIHFMIGSLVVVLQPQTSPIFEIQNAAMREFPSLICSHYSQSGTGDHVLDLFNALNLLAPSM